MRDYSVVSPQFWLGRTGRKLRGDQEAQIVAFYLLTSPHANMIGMYYLPVATIALETGLSVEGAWKGLRRGIEGGYCRFDEDAEVVWIVNMARFQIGSELSPKDNRCKWVRKTLESLPKNKFLKEFFDVYGAAFHLSFHGLDVRGFEGASESLRRDTDPDPAPDPVLKGVQGEKKSEPEKQNRRALIGSTEGASKGLRKSPSVPMPVDFTLTYERAQYVETVLGSEADAAALFEQFRLHQAAHDGRYVDWDAAWRTWVQRALQYGYPKKRAGAPDFERLARDIEREEAANAAK